MRDIESLSTMQKDKDKRKRQTSSLKISNWHYAAKQSKKTQKKGRNSLKKANEIGVAYTREPTVANGSRLLEEFHPFLMKYYTLLTGKYDGKGFNKDTRQFLSLFISQGQERPFSQVLHDLPNMAIQANLDGNDIYNELVVLFLELAKTYDPTIGTFTGFIQNRFKYAVKMRLFKIQNDAINYQPLFEVPLEASHEIGEDIEGEKTEPEHLLHEPDLIEQIDLPRLNLSFVSNPESPYDTLLNKHERAILVKTFVEDKNLTMIANELGYSNTAIITEILTKALTKLRRYLNQHKESLE